MEIHWFFVVVHHPNKFACTNFNPYTHINHAQQHHKIIHSLQSYNHCASLLCRANNWCALLMCRMPISTTHNFGSYTNTCCTQSVFVSRAIFVSSANILHAFHSTHFTMPKFSMPPPCTNTLRTPLTKLLHDNIYPHCTCTNKILVHSPKTMHTTHAIIMCVHTVCQYYACIIQSTSCNAKFSTCTHFPIFFHTAPNFNAHTYTQIFFCAAPIFSVHSSMPIFFHATPNFSVCTSMLIFFHAMPNFSAHTHRPIFFLATQNFSAHTSTPRFFHAIPNFSTRTCSPIFFHTVPNFSTCTITPIFFCVMPNFTYHNLFTLHHAFLVHPPAHIHFYVHQFLMNSTTKIGAFA
jgi:hypothetical protein